MWKNICIKSQRDSRVTDKHWETEKVESGMPRAPGPYTEYTRI